MATKRVGSSVIAMLGYDDERRILEVTFHTGRVYHYLGVPPNVYLELLASDSKGKYFNQKIRPKYRAKLVRRAAAAFPG